MGSLRITLYSAALLSLIAAGAIWWIVSAGLMTVYRTVVYNFSSIDDYLLFPQRRLTAAPHPFRFRAGGSAGNAPLPVSFGRRHDVPLSELLPATDTTAFLVVYNDLIVCERYDNGYDRATLSLSFSMAKSVLSILVGCAMADGYLQSVAQPVTDVGPELKAKGFAAVTLKHLLHMTSGMDYAENEWPFGVHARFSYTNRLAQEILDLRLREPPGTPFTYKSGDAYLLTLALRRALGRTSITAYTQERLWPPWGWRPRGRGASIMLRTVWSKQAAALRPRHGTSPSLAASQG